MKRQSRALLYLLPLMAVQVYGQDPADGNAGTIADAETQFLFINMLEFLGEFETEEGDWISPEILEGEAFADLDVPGSVAGQASTGNRRETPALEDDD